MAIVNRFTDPKILAGEYIPFKREKMTYSTRYQTSQDVEMLAENNSWLRTKMTGQGSYRIKQRLVNKQLKNN